MSCPTCRHRGKPSGDIADVYDCTAFGDVDTLCTENPDAVGLTVDDRGPILACGPTCNFYDPPIVKAKRRKGDG